MASITYDLKDIEAVLKNALPQAKFTKPTFEVTAEYLRLFVLEAINRATALAKQENSKTVETVHLQKILPQLLLDF